MPYKNGFIEFYFSLTLLIILSTGVALIAQKQIDLIQLENKSWQLQNESWFRNSVNQKPDLRPIIEQNKKNKNLRIQKSLKKNFNHKVLDGVGLALQYYQCKDLHEPASFLVFKHLVYPHQQNTLVQEDSSLDLIAPWFTNFTFETKNKNLESYFLTIKQSFTDTKLTSSGALLKRALWQEATLKTPYKAVPFEWIAGYELLSNAIELGSVDLGPLPFGRGVFKKALQKIKDQIFDMPEVQQAKTVKIPVKQNNSNCQTLATHQQH